MSEIESLETVLKYLRYKKANWLDAQPNFDSKRRSWFKFLISIDVTTVTDGNEKTNVSPSKLRLHWASHGFFCK